MEVLLTWIIVGMIFLFLGGIGIINAIKKQKQCARKCIARIIDVDKHVEESRNSSGTVVWKKEKYCPVYEYTVDGKIYSGKASIEYDEKDFCAVGSKIDIRYNIKNPEEFILEVECRVGIRDFLMMIAGLIIIFIGIRQYI